LVFAALVHNIGYALIPQEILYKQEKLSEEEWKIMKGHSSQGAELLEYLDVPTEVVLVARQHHEHINGKGYPTGLHGDEIHLFSRICSIADVYDALTSQKPYGAPPLSPSQAIVRMQEMEGKFDPHILNMMGTA
jgi:HD-GYP domain-containing protein (c-di-GMP phosphodiesterase class II)